MSWPLTTDVTFADRVLLWPLASVFVAWLLLLWWRSRRTREPYLLYSSVGALRGLPRTPRLALRPLLAVLRVLAVALVLVALLRPQTARSQISVSSQGIDVVLVLDTSGSMQALDLDPDRDLGKRRTRLTVAKSVLARFIEARGADQLGLVVFGEHAYTQSPLTLDHAILLTLLDRAEIGMVGDATALGDGIGAAIKRLQRSTAKSKVVIALTDGVSNAGSLAPRAAAEIAKSLGIRVYTVAAGALGEAPFLVDTPVGRRVLYQQNTIDEETMRAIAETTGASYFRATDASALDSIYQQIDQLERSEIETERFTEYDDQYRWLVAPALVLVLLEIGLSLTWLRKLP